MAKAKKKDVADSKANMAPERFIVMSRAFTYDINPAMQRTLPTGWAGLVPASVAEEIEASASGRIDVEREEMFLAKQAEADGSAAEAEAAAIAEAKAAAKSKKKGAATAKAEVEVNAEVEAKAEVEAAAAAATANPD